ncbi:MAG TPA: potassium channel family protein [Verrucomicrobiae bacterium]|jgi:hypothetical protein|nr:potassium channel family protein [Verrucomicrobiae bacterium]
MKAHWIFHPRHRKHFHAAFQRGLHAVLVVVGLTAFGTAAVKFLENRSWVDAFYFTSMIVTAQGPSLAPATAAGKMFASLFSFVAVGIGLASITYICGPFAADLESMMQDEQKRRRGESPEE